ncbi:MAG: IS66 family transposase, partial [Chloroflexi bacterium]|nr:IS66 family transposase [Chloroflexota bacterium]
MMDLAAENKHLREEIAQLRERIKELEALLGQDSRNSNWPPSRDKSRKKRRRTRSQRQKSNKKAGGQPGHKGQTLEMSPNPDYVEHHRPASCAHCQNIFDPAQVALHTTRRQVIDIPPIQTEVTEHRRETLCCAQCGQETSGRFPEAVTHRVQYGANIKQVGVYLKIAQLLPYDRTRQCLADLFQVNLSPGTLQNVVQKAAQRLEPVVENIREKIVAAEVGHFDETGFYIGGQRHWLHSSSTTELTFYFPHRSRGRKATAAAGILARFRGTAVHDNWATYWHYQACQHGLCNAHHLRNLTAIEEIEQQHWATHFKALLRSAKHLVEAAKEEGLTALPAVKSEQLERLYDKLVNLALLKNQPPAGGWPTGKRGRPKKTKPRNLAERLQKRRAAVLAFVYDFKVPFDNNLAERDIRMLKVQQKISGCFRSPQGAKDFC